MALGETARLIASLELDPRKFTSGVNKALGSVGRLESGLGRMGKGAGQLGAGLTRAGLVVGGAAIAGIGAAAKAAIDFEDAFAGVRKTVNESELTAVGLSFDKLAQQFRGMATEIPIAATEFARIGETAGALGIKAQDIQEFTKTVALLGETTNLSTDAAGEALGKLGTILGLTGKDFTEFADALVNLGNQGASTEAEIIETAKRFAGVGRQAGLTKEEILALSSAITSLGAEPEAGGSALSRIFSNMGTEIANATSKGKAFAELTGDSLKTLAARINKGDSLGIFRDTIEGLNKLKTTTAKYKFLEELGIKNVRDRDAIIKIANDTTVLDEALKDAAQSTGALGKEAQKRFDTVASKIKLLKNNVIEAAITVGEGLTPALGRAATKLSDFLKDPVNKGQLKALGEDIGAAIDKIDWKNVLDGAKTFFGVLKDAAGIALDILKTLNTLPTEVKAAGLGLIGLNKISGGLIGAGIGNLVGGLTQGLGSALVRAGIGKAFVQPVFVTNMGVGGMGGGAVPGAGGGLSTLAKVALVGEAIGLVLAVNAVREAVQNNATVQAQGIHQTLRDSLAGPNTANDLKTKLDGINAGIAKLEADPLAVALVTGPALDELKSMRSEVVAELQELQAGAKRNKSGSPDDRDVSPAKRPLTGSVFTAEQTKANVKWAKISAATEKSNTKLDQQRQRLEAVRGAVTAAKASVDASRSAIVSGGHSDAASIVGAIRAIQRPIVSVSVTGNQVRTVYSTGGTVTRNVQPGILKLL